MILCVKSGSSSFALDLPPGTDVACLKVLLAKRTGIQANKQVLRLNSKTLRDGDCTDAPSGSILTVCGRLRGGNSGSLKITVRPRVQKDKWSLYWKESMETKTEALADVVLEMSAQATVADVQAALKAKLSWSAAEAERLEGFKDPWESAIYNGRTMEPTRTLEAHGITNDATLTCIRRVLVPEAWRIIEEGQEEEDLSSDEEDW